MIKILLYESQVIGEIFVADTFLKRFLGFMFRKIPHYEGILIKPCNCIHTFFMRFSIDVLFVDENMDVIKKMESVKPGKVTMPIKGGVMVIEGIEGKFKNIEEGDKVLII